MVFLALILNYFGLILILESSSQFVAISINTLRVIVKAMYVLKTTWNLISEYLAYTQKTINGMKIFVQAINDSQ